MVSAVEVSQNDGEGLLVFEVGGHAARQYPLEVRFSDEVVGEGDAQNPPTGSTETTSFADVRARPVEVRSGR